MRWIGMFGALMACSSMVADDELIVLRQAAANDQFSNVMLLACRSLRCNLFTSTVREGELGSAVPVSLPDGMCPTGVAFGNDAAFVSARSCAVGLRTPPGERETSIYRLSASDGGVTLLQRFPDAVRPLAASGQGKGAIVLLGRATDYSAAESGTSFATAPPDIPIDFAPLVLRGDGSIAYENTKELLRPPWISVGDGVIYELRSGAVRGFSATDGAFEASSLTGAINRLSPREESEAWKAWVRRLERIPSDPKGGRLPGRAGGEGVRLSFGASRDAVFSASLDQSLVPAIRIDSGALRYAIVDHAEDRLITDDAVSLAAAR